MTGPSNGAGGTTPPAGKGKKESERKGWYARSGRWTTIPLRYLLMIAPVFLICGVTLWAIHPRTDLEHPAWAFLATGVGAYAVLVLVHRAITGQWHDDRRSYDPPSEWSPAARPGGNGPTWRRAVARTPIRWLERVGETIGLAGLVVWMAYPRADFEFAAWVPLAVGIGTFAVTSAVGFLVVLVRYDE